MIVADRHYLLLPDSVKIKWFVRSSHTVSSNVTNSMTSIPSSISQFCNQNFCCASVPALVCLFCCCDWNWSDFFPMPVARIDFWNAQGYVNTGEERVVTLSDIWNLCIIFTVFCTRQTGDVLGCRVNYISTETTSPGVRIGCLSLSLTFKFSWEISMFSTSVGRAPDLPLQFSKPKRSCVRSTILRLRFPFSLVVLSQYWHWAAENIYCEQWP